MKSLAYAVLIALLLGAGFYFKIVTFDPLSLVIIVMLLWNNAISVRRQEELARLQAKSHEVLVANQKLTLKAVEDTRAEVRKRR